MRHGEIYVKVRLHSNEKGPADATDATLKGLPSCGAFLLRGSDGEVVFDSSGIATIVTTNPGFIRFAVGRQGYVAEVLP
ncbi:MAG: hypothetical protein KAW17_09535 [Candidatus Eisenbacteria sp.]|nr:hypothetical protein [Candidatus Eisenbacteria bacterium]